MIRALKVVAKGRYAAAVDTVTLDHDSRFRRRIALTGDKGTAFLLDLPDATVLRDGDGVELEDGRVVMVRAAREDVMEVTGADPLHLTRLAWHIGNRHLPAAILPDRILIRPDHVIAEMIEGLGGTVRPVTATFEPEGGAYAHARGPIHAHGLDDGDGGGDGGGDG